MTQVAGFTNGSQLLHVNRTEARSAALEIAAEGLRALDPKEAARRAVRREADSIIVRGRRHPVNARSIHVLGAGKASLAIAAAVAELIGDVISSGAVVVHDSGSAQISESIEIIESDHPIPTDRSHSAAEGLAEAARRVEPGDLVIACFTGGSSALASSPAPGITFEEKIRVSEILLASGMDIVEMNTVRKHISAIKGGRLAALMTGATILNLTVSDVAGSHLDSITDPTVQDTTTAAGAVAILERFGLWDRIPASVRNRLRESVPAPDLSDADIQTVVVASGRDACQAMEQRASSLGYAVTTVSTDWSGQAADNGRRLGEWAVDCRRGRGLVTEPGVLVACGGESTVTLQDWKRDQGRGGPNQELALAAAAVIAGEESIAVLAVDTDGRDGGTEWAGALVDGDTGPLLGTDSLTRSLETHDSTAALATTGDLVASGHTGTNVNDLYVAVVGHV